MLLPAFEAFRDHAHEQAPLEVCGIIVNDLYIPCRNVAEDDPRHNFQIHAEDSDAAEDQGQIQAVCHSHAGSPAPSGMDVERCQEDGVPWFILGHHDELQRIDPRPIPFLERPFQFGWSDCWSLVRDFYGDLPDFPREVEFWTKGHSPFVDQFAACGFRDIGISAAESGDAVLMRFNGNGIPNHVGVLLGDGRLLHHPRNQFSRVDLLGPYLGHVTHFLRRVKWPLI